MAVSRWVWVGTIVLGIGLVDLPAPTPAEAQDTTDAVLRGRVLEADTNTPLPQAQLRVEGTYRGTITNAEGRYTLALDSLPATVVVRYVGYETARRRITDETALRQTVRLVPSTVEMDEVVVTGSGTPGADIMRRVIERKQAWWPTLRTYSVKAYNRFTLASDTTIAAIAESRTTAFWDAARGSREVVRSQRGTANLRNIVDGALPAATSILNLYRDNVTVFGNRLVGVTHPEALDYYDFTLDTTRAVDGQKAFRIRVEPSSRVSSTFRGTVTVLDSAYALLEAELRPTASLSTSRVLKEVDIAFEQQFSNYGGDYWLPVDFRARRELDVQVSALVSFSNVQVRQVSRLSDYRINVLVPDSLYDTEEVVRADSAARFRSRVALAPDSGRDGGPFVPYSRAERDAYARIDSTDAIQDAFDPGGLVGWLQTLGLFGEDGLRFGVTSNGGDAQGGASTDTTGASERDEGSTGGAFLEVDGGLPILRYNRVEEAHLGARLDLTVGPFDGTVRGGYNTGPSGPTRWTYGGELAERLGTGTELTLSYHYGIEPRYQARSRIAPIWARLTSSLWALAGEPEYFDYLGAERVRFTVRQAVGSPDLDLALQFRNERHFSVAKTTDYDLLGRTGRQPANPPVAAGRLRSAALTATLGESGILGVTPIDRVEASVEYSNPAVAASDFDFARVEVVADARIETFFQRRWFPNTLDLRLDAGASVGTLPPQRFGVVEASPLPYTPFGALRTLDDRPCQGEHHAALFWEHNFRTVPFELIGWEAPVARDIELIVHGGHGRTWIETDTEQRLLRRGVRLRTADGFHHELGLSVNGLLNDTLRLDVTRRLDAAGFSVGVSLLRFL